MNLTELVRDYYKARGLTTPTADQALMFLVSEVGELADANVQAQSTWKRNNDRERNIDDEVGDILLMLTMYCIQTGLDPVQCMLDKFAKKGYKPCPQN